MEEPQKRNGIQVISRATAILRVLGKSTGGLSLGQIANSVELPRSTVQRIVGALAAEGLVSTSGGSGRIRLGPEIQSLALSSAITPQERLRPIMQDIANKTGETVDLAVLRDGQMLFVDQIVGSQRLRTVSSIGEIFPLTTTANGKAALACLDESEATALVLAELRSLGPGARRLSEILGEIDEIRDGELATDADEHTDGISAVGFGVKDPSGAVFAISVPVPTTRFERQRDCLVDVMQKAREAS